MTAARGFALGLAAGVAAAAAFGLAFRDAPHSEVVSVAAPAPEPERIAIESPWADVPPQRRTYTLSLNNPDVVGAEAADHMRPEDLVVGVVVGRDSRAYPWWVMSQYHVVNDTVGTVPIYVGLCEVCTGASAFVPIVEEKPNTRLSFEHSGVHEGTFEISDLETLSQWHPFTGIARSGPLAGSKLVKLPTFLERWERWSELHPDTDVVLGSERLRAREHGAHAGQNPGDAYMPGVFAKTARMDDQRLSPHALVYGLISRDGRQRLAVPLDALPQTGFMALSVGDTPVVLFRRGDLRVHAFETGYSGEVLRFELVSEDPALLRDQNGTVWDAWGVAVEGPEEGQTLRAARGYVTEWYEWVTAEPGAEIHPGNG